MSPQPKGEYDASARRAASQQRRVRILAVARDLFVAHGYVGTTMSAIAREAGVNIDTVYELVGRKPELFRLLVEAAISGQGAPVAAEQRDYVRAIHQQDSPEAKLETYAAALPELHQRLAPLVEVLKQAGASEPDLAAMWHGISERRYRNMGRLAAELAGSGRLAVDQRQAADVIWALNSPEVYALLVLGRGWSHEQYSAWLRDTWVASLLQPAEQPG